MPKKYEKMRYYRVVVKFSRDDKYEVYLKGNGLEDENVVEYMTANNLFHGEMDVDYVKEITEITRKEYEANHA